MTILPGKQQPDDANNNFITQLHTVLEGYGNKKQPASLYRPWLFYRNIRPQKHFGTCYKDCFTLSLEKPWDLSDPSNTLNGYSLKEIAKQVEAHDKRPFLIRWLARLFSPIEQYRKLLFYAQLRYLEQTSGSAQTEEEKANMQKKYQSLLEQSPFLHFLASLVSGDATLQILDNFFSANAQSGSGAQPPSQPSSVALVVSARASSTVTPPSPPASTVPQGKSQQQRADPEEALQKAFQQDKQDFRRFLCSFAGVFVGWVQQPEWTREGGRK